MRKEFEPLDISILAIFGPTAVGKSRVAVAVAKKLGGEIVSADSMQVYRGLPILTDQPTADMLAEVPHHLIAAIDPEEEYSAAEFARLAEPLICDIGDRGNLPMIVGGTGLYLRALLGGFSFAGSGGRSMKQKWDEHVRQVGVEAAFRELQTTDPDAAACIDRDNPRRLARALESAEVASSATGNSTAAERHRLWSAESPYRVLSFALTAPREDLYRQIDLRVERMLTEGAVDEVRLLRESRVSVTAAQAIGFRELCAYLDGQVTLEEAAATIRQKSHRYAKRQLTWMRKMPDIVRIDVAGLAPDAIATAIIDRIHDTSD
ncbi:MAG: tRNA (adenosine(37)-N6)-dimethylallyltransferase MiaA [Thermoleophilia bacterium]|nr:tRNA (adenosine(37)-N6)-dimethylallyltransferase MiaA [Thermoleophilia bacterium]